MKSIRLSWTLVLLALVLVLALAARTYGLDFPRYHWDENINFDSVLYASFSHLALQTYVHGSFLQYLVLGFWDIFLAVTGVAPTTQNLLMAFFREGSTLPLIARALLVGVGTLTVAVTFVLGKRLCGARVGLLAAFFLALTFLHVSESHYARGHILATFFVTLAVYFCARILSDPHARNYALAGVCIGLATAAEYSALLAVVALVAAHFARGARRSEWRALLIGLDSSALAFFCVTPYALLNFPFFAGEMKWFLTQVVSRTWVSPEGQPVLLFYFTEHLRNGMGLPLELLAVGGVVSAIYRHRPADWVLLAFPLSLLVTLSKGENFARYALPLLPFLVILAARFLRDAIDWLAARTSPRLARVTLIVVAVGAMVPSTLNIARYDYWLTQPDTRALAADWITAKVPDEATMIVEGAGVLGPSVPVSRMLLDQQIAAQSPASVGKLYLEAQRANLPTGPGYRVDTVFRLDQVHESGILVGSVQSAQEYVARGVDYLVTVDWMQRDDADHYSPEFQRSLEAAYQPIAKFEPTIAFRFDPYAWRMDYDALARVVPGQPVIGGPRITIYRRRGAD